MPASRELTLVRVFDAPRDLVFQAWTDPALLAQWWGPDGVTNPVCELDSRPQGAFHIVMLAGDSLGELKGSRWPTRGVFLEVLPPERLVFTATAFFDEHGKNPQLENLNTVTFEDLGGKTRVTLHVVVRKASPAMEAPLSGMPIGWSQSLGRLATLLTSIA